MPRLRRTSSQRPTSATVPASTPTTRRLPPLPRCTTSVPASGSKSFVFSASASPMRSPQRHSTATSARLRTPVGALLEQRRMSSSISAPVSRSASSLEPFPRPTLAPSSALRAMPYGPANERCPPGGASGFPVRPGSPLPSGGKSQTRRAATMELWTRSPSAKGHSGSPEQASQPRWAELGLQAIVGSPDWRPRPTERRVATPHSADIRLTRPPEPSAHPRSAATQTWIVQSTSAPHPSRSSL